MLPTSAAPPDVPSLPDPARFQSITAPAPTPALTPRIGRRVSSAVVQEGGQEETLTFPKAPKVMKTGAQLIGRKTAGQEEDIDFAIRTEMPDPGELYQRLSEAQLMERIRQDARKRPGSQRVYFPTEPVIGKGPYEGRHFHPMVETVEPAFVCHKRLLFEQPNFERYVWDLGAIQPPVQLLVFYYDMVMLPYHLWDRPCEDFDCSPGKCLPGDSTPLYLWRERFSLSGLAAEAATFWGGAFIFR